MTDYLALIPFAAVLAGMFYLARRAEAQRRARGDVIERSAARTLVIVACLAVAAIAIISSLADTRSIGELAIGSIPLLIFAFVALVYWVTRKR